MGLATSRRLQEKRCEDSLMELLRQVDVSQDWNVDPILQQNCRVGPDRYDARRYGKG
jgi:hypothetical protein